MRVMIPPYIPESRLDGCDIIDIRYELVFKIEVSGGSQLKVTVPITVGTANGSATTTPMPATPRYKTAAQTNGGTRRVGGGDDGGGGDGDAYILAENELAPSDRDAAGANVDGVSVNLDDDEAEKFRYPMAPGETRRNPIFENN